MTDDAVPARGSLRSRGAALVSALTLRQLGGVLPPERAWGLWLSRQIVTGGAEMLVADARHLAADIRAADGNCELQVWPDQVPVFQALPRLSPEAAKPMAHVARFIDTSMRANGFDAIAGKAG
jgi:acetyl esterase/lipase